MAGGGDAPGPEPPFKKHAANGRRPRTLEQANGLLGIVAEQYEAGSGLLLADQ